MRNWLHSIDVWLFELVSTVWGMYWPIVLIVLCFTVVERCFPLERAQPWQALRFNLAWQLLSLTTLFVLSAAGWDEFIAWLTQLFPGPLIPLKPAASAGGEAARVLLVVALGDLCAYWAHRLMHRMPALWSIHRLHHDEEHVHAATGFRQHWLNQPFLQLLLVPPLAWLLGAQSLPAAIGVGLSLLLAFQHANIRLELGPLTRLIAGPQWHRLHHGRAPELYNCNFATAFPLWDILFGTYRHPRKDEFIATGLQGVPASRAYGRTFFAPMADWWRGFRPDKTRARHS